MRLFAWPGSVTRGGLINDELAGSDVGSAERRGSSGRSSGGGSSSHGSQQIGRLDARSGEHGETIRLACTSSIRQTSCCESMRARIPVIPAIPQCWPGIAVAVVKWPWSLWTRQSAPRVATRATGRGRRGDGSVDIRREGEGRARVSAASNASQHGLCKTAALAPPRIPAILSRISPSRGSMSRSSNTMRPPLSWCRPVSEADFSLLDFFLFLRIFRREWDFGFCFCRCYYYCCWYYLEGKGLFLIFINFFTFFRMFHTLLPMCDIENIKEAWMIWDDVTHGELFITRRYRMLERTYFEMVWCVCIRSKLVSKAKPTLMSGRKF